MSETERDTKKQRVEMDDSFILEVVSNASPNVYPNNTISSFSNFLPEQINLDDGWEVALSEIAYPNLYHNVSDGRFRYKHDSLDKDLQIYEIPAGLYHSLNDILAAMREVAAPTKTIDFTWRVNNRTQHVDITLPDDFSALNIISPDLTHILSFPMSILLNGKGPHKSHFPVDLVRFHAILIYMDIIDHVIVGDSKVPLLRSFPFICKMKNSDIVTQQYMNYHTFSNLHYKKLIKHSFHSIQAELRTNTTGEFIPFVAIGYTRLTLLFRKISRH